MRVCQYSAVSVAHRILWQSSNWPSVAYWTLAKISHRLYLKLSHRTWFSHVVVHTPYSIWLHHCSGPVWTLPHTWCHNLWSMSDADQQEDKRAQNSTTEASFCMITTHLSIDYYFVIASKSLKMRQSKCRSIDSRTGTIACWEIWSSVLLLPQQHLLAGGVLHLVF